MIKHFFKISFYAFVTFCVINFIILLFQILLFSLYKEIPNIAIGFPFKFYYTLLLDERDLQHGSNLDYFIYDSIIFWIIVFIYFQLKNKIKPLNHFKQHKTKINYE